MPLLPDVFDRQDPAVVSQVEQTQRSISSVRERAQRAGRLRTGIAVGGLMVSVTQYTRLLPGTCCTDLDRFVRRHLQLFLDALRAPACSVLVGDTATLEDLQARPS